MADRIQLTELDEVVSGELATAHFIIRSKRIPFPARGGKAFLRIPTIEVRDSEDGAGVWLFRAESGACGIIFKNVPVYRGNVSVRNIAVLHDGDEITIGGTIAKFFEIVCFKLEPESRLVCEGKCLYCAEPRRVGMLVYRCPHCGETYHEDCWNDMKVGNRKCASRNCRFSPGLIESK